MKVYYGKNFWGNGEPGSEMQEIPVHREFTWEDISGIIPAVYLCDEGIAVDFCVRISNEIVQDFWREWHQKLGQGMDEEERRMLIEENPLNIDFNVSICVNGKQLENDFGCGAGYTKIFGDQIKNSFEEQLCMEYGCDENNSWVFKRFMYRWIEKPEKPESIEVCFQACDKPFECDAIEIRLGDVGKVFELAHPVSGRQYTLFVDEIEQQKLQGDIWESIRHDKTGSHRWEYPVHYLAVSYHLQPAPARNAFVMQSAGKGDMPRCLSQNQAAGICVIGGADGPASIFIAGKCDKEKRQIAVGELHFEPVERGLWKPVFMVKERGDMKMTLFV